LGFIQKIELFLKKLTYHLSMHYVSFPLNISANNLFDTVGIQYPLKSLILLNKTNRDSIVINRNLSKTETIQKLVIINQFEWQYFTQLLQSYTYVFPNSHVHLFWQKYREILKKSLEKVDLYSVDIQKFYDNNTYSKIFELIK